LGSDDEEGFIAALEDAVASEILKDEQFLSEIKEGCPWGRIKAFIKDRLPELIADDRDELAYKLVPQILNKLFGPQNIFWETYKHPERDKTYVRLKK